MKILPLCDMEKVVLLLLLPFNSQGQHTDHSGALLFAGGTCMQYLYVSGPLDFRFVIQVLFGQRMILNACARRQDLGLTSHLNDAALPYE